MVVIQIKRGDLDGFLYETSCENTNDVIVREIVRVWNLRIILAQLLGGLRELAQYGPAKPTDKVGLDEVEEKYNNKVLDKGEFYIPDPTGNRTGNGVGPQLTETINRVIADTEAILDKNNVTRKIAITKAALSEKIDNIRGVVIMAFPMGLPEWDTVKIAVDECTNCIKNNTPVDGASLDGTAAGQEILDESTAELWIASRCLDRRECFYQKYGRNEKTKVIGKLQKLGGGAPGREAAVSEDERKAMMAYYFKKQEELKRIAENNEDEYLNSCWANPKQLQQQLRGQSGIKAPGIH